MAFTGIGQKDGKKRKKDVTELFGFECDIYFLD